MRRAVWCCEWREVSGVESIDVWWAGQVIAPKVAKTGAESLKDEEKIWWSSKLAILDF